MTVAANNGEPAVTAGSKAVVERIVFYGTFGVLLGAPLAFGAVEPWAILLLEVSAVLLFALWIWSQVAAGELRISGNPVFGPMAAFAGLALLQILTGRTAYRYLTLRELQLYCAYGLLCFLAVQCLRKTSQLNLVAVSAIVLGAGIAILALLQSLSSPGELYWFRVPAAGGWTYGPYVNHNHYAGLMELLVPIPLVIGLGHLARRPQRILALSAAAIMAATIFLSGSRGGMLAFSVQFVMLGAFLIRLKKGRNLALTVGPFAALLVGLLVWIGGGNLSSRIASIRSETHTEVSGGTRLAIVRDGLKMFKDRPLLGWGLAAFPDVYPKYRSFYTNLFVNEAHNDYLQLLVETGLLGFGVLLWFLATTYYQASTKLSKWTSDSNGALALAAMLSCTGILVHSFLDFNLHIPANAALFYCLCTLAALEPRFPLLYSRRFHRRGESSVLTT